MRILAIVTAGDVVEGSLAAEALKSAGAALGVAVRAEVRLGRRVIDPIGAEEPAPGDHVLWVGGDDPAGPLRHLPSTSAGLDEVLADPAGVAHGLLQAQAQPTTGPLVAVTSCPTGIAHTYMAAEALVAAAEALGIPLRVETQGSVGANLPLTEAEIAAADVVIIAADREVERSRFAGKRVFVSGTKPAITDAKGLIGRALAEARLQAPEPGVPEVPSAGPTRSGPYRHLMTGVSFMLPFVVAGGLLIAMAFAFGGIYADRAEGTFANALFRIGAQGAFALIVPVLAGYIGFSIADRPGIAPGMVGGMMATSLGAGFLGGIVAGFVAGYCVSGLNRWTRLPKGLEGLKPVLLLPVLGTLATGLIMIYAVGGPVAELLDALTRWLRGLESASAIVLGLLLGAMMAFDMGGPVNKAAYVFATGLVASQVYTPMAAAMAAGMTPPLAVALATRLFANRFTQEERAAGPAAAVLGLAFITEGAIPFAARDPLRVIPALMTGAAISAAISMALGAELRVPHGGVFVLPIPGAVTHLAGYLVALLAGVLAGALLLGTLKRPLGSAVIAEPRKP